MRDQSLPRYLRLGHTLPGVPGVEMCYEFTFTGGTGGKTKDISFRLRTWAYEATLSDTVIVP